MSHQFQPTWPSSHARPESTTTNEIHEELPEIVTMDELRQGDLYILKSKLVVIALFQGWNDEMCCFSVLRTDMLDDLRWYEARYLPMNFDAFPAFDYAGNPSIFLFPKQLRAIIPINWFNIFEEARHAQRVWKKATNGKPTKSFYFLEDTGAEGSDQELETVSEEIQEEAGENDDLSQSNISTQQENDDAMEESSTIKNDKAQDEQSSYQQEQKSLSPQPLQATVPSATVSKAITNKASTKSFHQRQSLTPSPHPPRPPLSSVTASREVIKETPAKTFQRQMEMQTKDVALPKGSKLMDTKEPTNQGNTNQRNSDLSKRRSLGSFFRKKSKKVDKKEIKEPPAKEEKRKSAPPSTKATSVKSAIPKQEKPPLPKQEMQKEEEIKKLDIQNKSTMMKKKSIDKLEIFDYETFFDMQATFAFLNNNDPFEKFENTLTSIPVANK